MLLLQRIRLRASEVAGPAVGSSARCCGRVQCGLDLQGGTGSLWTTFVLCFMHSQLQLRGKGQPTPSYSQGSIMPSCTENALGRHDGVQRIAPCSEALHDGGLKGVFGS